MEYDKKYKEVMIVMFFDYIKSKNKGLYAQLNEGLSKNEIFELTKNLTFNLPEEIINFYSLKNGVAINNNLLVDQKLMFENGIFMPLEQSVSEYNVLKHEVNMEFKFPLFDNGLGDFLLIDCDKESKTYKRILFWSPPLLVVEPISIYDSFMKLILTTMRCFIVKAYFYNRGKGLEVDSQKLCEVGKEYNPQSMYWNQRV